MNQQLSVMPQPWSFIGYTLLAMLWLSCGWFLVRYTTKLPWASTEAGRHLVAMSANLFGFATLYGVRAVWPDFPGRGAVLFVLLIGLVVNTTWRLVMLERYLRQERARAARAEAE